MKKILRKKNFTLVELIVAMAVFSILLLLMLQFFSGAQRIWHGMEKRNEIYANARIAMDLITTHLQNTYSPNGSIVFFVDDPNTESSKIYFATRTDCSSACGSSFLILYAPSSTEFFLTYSGSAIAREGQVTMTIFKLRRD